MSTPHVIPFKQFPNSPRSNFWARFWDGLKEGAGQGWQDWSQWARSSTEPHARRIYDWGVTGGTQDAKNAMTRVERFFKDDPTFTRHPGLDFADRQRLFNQLVAARQAHLVEMSRADQLEIQRRAGVAQHKQAQAQSKPVTRFKNARAAVLGQIEQGRQQENSQFQQKQTAFDQAQQTYKTTQAHAPLIWPWNWGLRYRNRRIFKQAQTIYKTEKKKHETELKRLRKDGRRGLLWGIVGGQRLRQAALNLRDSAKLQYEAAEAKHEADNVQAQHDVFATRSKARQDLQTVRAAVNAEQRQNRRGHLENLKHDTKNLVNSAGNVSAATGHATKAGASYAVAKPAPHVAHVVGGTVGAVVEGIQTAFRRAWHKPSNPTP